MTEMGVKWLAHQETQRSNLAKESETYRSNIAREGETHRSNIANEEQKRAELRETARSNVAKESETHRANVAKEYETARSNKAKEQETKRSNLAKEGETYRSNVADEQLSGRKITNEYVQRAQQMAQDLYKTNLSNLSPSVAAALAMRNMGYSETGSESASSVMGGLSALAALAESLLPGLAKNIR